MRTANGSAARLGARTRLLSRQRAAPTAEGQSEDATRKLFEAFGYTFTKSEVDIQARGIATRVIADPTLTILRADEHEHPLRIAIDEA